MRNRCATVILAAAAALAASGSTSTTIQAQAGGQTYAPPKNASGQPDLQGVWRVWNLAKYDLKEVHTKINGGTMGQADDVALPSGTDSFTHQFGLVLPLTVNQLTIEACATMSKRDVAAVGASLPAVGTVKVDTNGNIVGAASYFDTIVTPGWIAKSTDVDNDTVTFDADPGWATGEAVRSVQSLLAFGRSRGWRVTAPLPLAQQLRGDLVTGRRAVVRLDGRAAGEAVIELSQLRRGWGHDE